MTGHGKGIGTHAGQKPGETRVKSVRKFLNLMS